MKERGDGKLMKTMDRRSLGFVRLQIRGPGGGGGGAKREGFSCRMFRAPRVRCYRRMLGSPGWHKRPVVVIQREEVGSRGRRHQAASALLHDSFDDRQPGSFGPRPDRRSDRRIPLKE